MMPRICLPTFARSAFQPSALARLSRLVERFFSKLKHFLRVATRYDKLAENFLDMVQLAVFGCALMSSTT
ncbi:hypothetical protein PV773_15180 [Mesorhizobium sp. CC13]|uniref:hypothetical protein n=1 Tax=Mesorhizobium sp. CC13 TaxID=3029194 RepID=UPI003264272B